MNKGQNPEWSVARDYAPADAGQAMKNFSWYPIVFINKTERLFYGIISVFPQNPNHKPAISYSCRRLYGSNASRSTAYSFHICAGSIPFTVKQSIIEIRTKDEKKIGLNCYVPDKSNCKVMIIAPKGGLTKEYYDPFARFMCESGFTVITFDYRGTGSSRAGQLKGYKASMHQWAVQDIDAVILYAKNNYPKQEIIYTGHCIGGEIIGLAQASQYISRLVLVNSALSCKRLWSLKNRFRLVAMKAAVSVLNKWFGYFPGRRIGLPGNMPAGVMHQWINWCDNSNGLFDTFPDNNYRKLQVPLLAFSFSDDWHCPPIAVQELLNRFANAQTTWYHLSPAEIKMKKAGTINFFDPQMKTTLWIQLLQWLGNEDRKERPVIY